MDISGEMLEAAAYSMYFGTLGQQQDATNFFANWQNMNDVLITSVKFLSAEASDCLQFLTCCVIMYATDTWFKYDRDSLDNIKKYILDFTFSENYSQKIREKLDQIVAKIAFNDWPENWPNFLPQMKSYLEMKDINISSHVFMILSNFLRTVLNSSKVTLKRRSQLLSYFIQNISELFVFASDTQSSEVAKAFLDFSEAMCLVIGKDSEMTVNFSLFIFGTFAAVDDLAPSVFKALSNLLAPNIYLTHLIKPILSLIEKKMSNGSILDVSFHEFCCLYLKNIIPIIEILCTTPDVSADIYKMFLFSLNSAPRDELSEPFWCLWDTSLKLLINSPGSLLCQIILPLMSNILTTFYELLPCSSHLSRLITPLTASAFSSLIKIIPEATLAFLLEQPPNLSLCFAVGLSPHREVLFPKLIQILETSINSVELPVVSAVLFAISRNSSLMSSHVELIGYLQQISANILLVSQNAEEDFDTTVLLALNHVASNCPEALTHTKEFVDLLFNCASPIRLQKDNFSRLCRILAKVILTTPSTVKQEYIERLTNIAAEPLSSCDIGFIAIGTQAAWSIASISLCGSYYITKYLWKPLLIAMNTARDNEVLSDIVSVFASSIRTAPFALCRKMIFQFIQLAQTVTGNDTAILDAYNLIYQIHNELSEFRDLFADTFVQRMAGNPQPSFFEFFSIAGLKDHEEQAVVGGACVSIHNPDEKISVEAAHLLKKLISRRKDPQFLLKWQAHIIRAVFIALFDELHSTVIVNIIKVLFSIYKRHIRNSTLSTIVDAKVVEAISETVGDSEVSAHFAASLRAVANSRDEFMQLIKDFLSSFGRLNPLELKLFDESLVVRSAATGMVHEQMVPVSGAVIHNEDEYVSQLS